MFYYIQKQFYKFTKNVEILIRRQVIKNSNIEI